MNSGLSQWGVGQSGNGCAFGGMVDLVGVDGLMEPSELASQHFGRALSSDSVDRLIAKVSVRQKMLVL